MKRIVSMVLILLSVVLLSPGLVEAAPFAYTERVIYNFITTKLMDEEGGIYSNYHNDYPDSDVAGVNHDMLSESLGLFMEYLYLYDDKRGFATQVKLLREKFLSPVGLLYWRVRENGEKEKSNALIDDLRVVKYLLLAGEKWEEDSYIKLAKKISKAIEEYNTYRGYLVEGADWSKGFIFGYSVTKAKRVCVPYLDLYAIELIRRKVNAFAPLYRSSVGIVVDGVKERKVKKFFYPRKGRYGKGYADSVNTLNAIQHLVDIGFSPYKFLEHLRVKFTNPAFRVDDTATCALSAEIFTAVGDRYAARSALKKMLRFYIKTGPLVGGIGYKERGRYHVYAFDNLLAIDALRRYSLRWKEVE